VAQSSKYVALFVAESREHLQQCNAQLLAWERDLAQDAPIAELFRNVHTMKGMAATLGYSRLANLAHAFEHVLSAVREGSVAPSAELVELGFRVVDRMEQGVGLAAEGRDDSIEDRELADELVSLARPATGTWPVPALRAEKAPVPEAGGVVIRVAIAPGTPMAGARAALVLRRAEALGAVSAVSPPPETWGSEAFTGDFACRIATTAADDAIQAELSQVGDVASVVVVRGSAPAAAAAPAAQVRVDLVRLDRLVSLGGEVSVMAHRLAADLARRQDPALVAAGHTLDLLVTALQEQVLQVRMAPVGEVFERFPRAVRDLARHLEKRVRLDIEGAEIELDRAILEQLPKILLHLLRNAVDHGIELPAVRKKAGKAMEGRIRLSARRDRNHVIITVADDGRGIDEVAVRGRARELGWHDEADSPDLLRILGRAGFSTRREVSEVSGRGVGFDAVLHRVRAMGGSTELRAGTEAGTTIVLRLPISLAVVPALLLRVADARFAIPLGFVAETARLAPMVDGGKVSYRGRELPLVALGRREAGVPRPGVILEVGGRQGVLLVDTLLGQEDVVVRPVHAPRGVPRWVNGATILSDGLPALVLDPTALV
jgi:two-component system chemotaxis sensor kinase CheA